MLPPLRSSSGSTSSYQNQSLMGGSGPSVSEAAYKVHFTDWKGDSNSSSAGKLNVLLLAGRERIADHLAMLADAVGQAIDLPRRENEGNGDYVIRLAEALSKITPRQRADVERQLNLVVQGLKLRFLFEAFANPTGPQAARIVAYLETARYKDRDLVARSVVTSYRQNGGPDAGAAEHAAPSPGEAAASPASQADGKPAMAQTSAEAAATPMTEQDGTAAAPSPPAGNAETPETTAAAPEAPETAPPAPALAEPETIESDGGIDARSLQTLLRRAFEGGESGDAAIEAKATAELLATAQERISAEIAGNIETVIEEPAEFELGAGFPLPVLDEQPTADESSPPLRARQPEDLAPLSDADAEQAGPAETQRGADPREMPARSAHEADTSTPTAHPHEEARPTLFTLKGWTEADFESRELATAYDIIAEDGAEAQAMIAAGIEDETVARDPIEAGAVADVPEPVLDDADSLYDPRRAAGLSGEAADEPATAPAVAEKIPTETPVARAIPVAVERQVLAQLQPSGREVPLFAIAPFSPLSDILSYDEETETEERRFQDDEAEGDDSAGDEHDKDGEDEDRARPPAPEIAAEDEDGQSERAYGLYQRMAGWA